MTGRCDYSHSDEVTPSTESQLKIAKDLCTYVGNFIIISLRPSVQKDHLVQTVKVKHSNVYVYVYEYGRQSLIIDSRTEVLHE